METYFHALPVDVFTRLREVERMYYNTALVLSKYNPHFSISKILSVATEGNLAGVYLREWMLHGGEIDAGAGVRIFDSST